MSGLTTYLQRQFIEHCPNRSNASRSRVFCRRNSPTCSRFNPVPTCSCHGGTAPRRIWIEFEISRADPVANHAKFGTAHLFEPKTPDNVFVSMVSSHVTRGRHNLAASSIFLLRHIGIEAFQTMLFPHMPADAIKTLNHLPFQQLVSDSSLSVTGEIERAIAVSTPIAGLRSHRIFFASNVLEVMLNLHQWNAEVKTESGRSRWGKRTVTYFVFDPRTHRFAPSKYCAFLPVRHCLGQENPAPKRPPTMDISTYAELDESDSRFDGAIARRHMCQTLCFSEEKLASSSPKIVEAFDQWIRDHAQLNRSASSWTNSTHASRMVGLMRVRCFPEMPSTPVGSDRSVSFQFCLGAVSISMTSRLAGVCLVICKT